MSAKSARARHILMGLLLAALAVVCVIALAPYLGHTRSDAQTDTVPSASASQTDAAASDDPASDDPSTGGSFDAGGELQEGSSASATAATTSVDGIDFEQVSVAYVIDGDTIVIRHVDGTKDKVRLIGIDAPESVSEDTSKNCEEGVLASEHLKAILPEGSTVYLAHDVSEHDRYGRLVRYVWTSVPTDPYAQDEVRANMVDAMMVADGFARSYRYRPDVSYADLFDALQDEAARSGLGVSYHWQ